MAVYKLNEITKTLDKLFKYNVKTTEKVANLKWQDLDSIGDFSPTDIIFGTHTLQNFPEDLYNTILSKKKMQDVIDIDGEVYEGLPIKRTSNIKASVTIMYGCNNFCTYCIVPYVRGRERSRHPKDILAEVEGLAKEGYKEITLLGQNVNSYLRAEKWKEEGKEYEGINSFATLLRTINKIEGIERIRFVSPHPKDFTDDVIDAYMFIYSRRVGTPGDKMENQDYVRLKFIQEENKLENQ